MPAKKKQQQQAAASTVEKVEEAVAAPTKTINDPELDKISAMANEVFAQAGMSTKEKKLQQKQMKQLTDQIQAQQQQYYRAQLYAQRSQEKAIEEEMSVANRTQQPVDDVPLEEHQRKWQKIADGKWIRYEQFTPKYMEPLMKMFGEELPEPYSAFTYEHFLSGWPILGLLLFGHEGEKAPETETEGGELIGSIVSRVTWKYPQNHWRGYIAMLAVRPNWRGHRLGQQLVRVTVEVMKKKKASEVVLETPVNNERALKLYTEMGFAKTKFLTRYYLDGSDAIRLKLWFQSPRE